MEYFDIMILKKKMNSWVIFYLIIALSLQQSLPLHQKENYLLEKEIAFARGLLLRSKLSLFCKGKLTFLKWTSLVILKCAYLSSLGPLYLTSIYCCVKGASFYFQLTFYQDKSFS